MVLDTVALRFRILHDPDRSFDERPLVLLVMSNSNHIDWVLPHDPNWGLRDLLTIIITSNGDGH
eukprot:5884530-Heterocapsa_arctica.AAC.1